LSLTRITTLPRPLASLARSSCSCQVQSLPSYPCECSAEGAEAASSCCTLQMDQLSIGVKPAGGAPCCFQRSASPYDSTERVHDAIRERAFWCRQVYDGKPTAAGERLAQSIDRPSDMWVVSRRNPLPLRRGHVKSDGNACQWWSLWRPRVSTGVAPGRAHCGVGRLVGPQVATKACIGYEGAKL
jgi:hypothetical protein